jgi:diguanylate cyclase (GGDEF)-like protein
MAKRSIEEVFAAAEWLGVPVEELRQAPPSVIESVTRRHVDELHAAAVHAEIMERLGELCAAAITDQVTRLPNRRVVEERLREALATAERSGSTVAVFVADVDGFKEVNDRLGHRAGDELLRAIAERIKACVRHGDLVGRWGGDEFVMVCKGVSADVAERIAAMTVARTEREPFTVAGSLVTVGVTVGWASVRGGTVDACIEAADASMYRRKRSGDRSARFAVLRERQGRGSS